MGGQHDTKEEHGGDDPKQSRHEQSESGSSGHGAASALAHMKDREHRHKAGEADNAAGANGQ